MGGVANLLIISCISSMLSGLVPIDHNFSFQRTFSFWPFFVTGLLFKKHHLMEKLKKVNIIFPIIVLLIGLVLSRYLPIYMPKYHYVCANDFILRIGQSILGMSLCLSIIRISSSLRFIQRFADYGAHTLWIYIGHTYLIIIGEKVFPYFGIVLNLTTALSLALVYCVLFIICSRYYRKKISKTRPYTNEMAQQKCAC